jgi:Putative MetA-pathway of phenol degradation
LSVRLARGAKFLIPLMAATFLVGSLHPQDLAPRAYLILPRHANAITISYSFMDGSLNFGDIVPISDSKAHVSLPVFSYSHSMWLFSRSANFSASLPYGVGNISAKVVDNEQHVYRSGMFDSSYRLSVNLYGGPAMDLKEYARWKQKTVVGVSVRVVAPTGQYDPTKLINYGSNRWAVKSELGLSHRLNHWIIDAYSGGWYYSTNPEFFSHNQYNPGTTTQKQSPIFAFEGHLSYDVKPRLWASLDGNYWHGGTTSLNGVKNPATLQSNSRVGGTLSVPVTRRQSFKFSYANGAYIRYGGNFQTFAVAWQYSWFGRPN